MSAGAVVFAVSLGFAAGLLAGFFGVGGGILFVPTLVAAYLLVRLAPGRMPGFAAPLSAAMVLLAGLTIALSLATGLPLQRAFSQRVAEFVYNRPALTLAVVAGPLALALWEQGEELAKVCQNALEGARARLDTALADDPED